MANIINADNGAVSLIPGLKTSADASGVLQFQNNGVTSLTVTSAGISVPEGNLKPLISGTAVTLTNQTSVDFTSLPNWIKRITMMYRGVSLNASSNILVQIGAGFFTTTGYISTCNSTNQASATGGISSTAGFCVRTIGGTAGIISGHMVISTLGDNIWISSYNGKSAATEAFWGGGDVVLGGTLDRVRITTVNGTDIFDAGSVNILYE